MALFVVLTLIVLSGAEYERSTHPAGLSWCWVLKRFFRVAYGSLLHDTVRSSHPVFLSRVLTWFAELAEHILAGAEYLATAAYDIWGRIFVALSLVLTQHVLAGAEYVHNTQPPCPSWCCVLGNRNVFRGPGKTRFVVLTQPLLRSCCECSQYSPSVC